MKKFGTIMAVILGLILLTVVSFTLRSCGIFQNHVEKSMENAVISYDEYQNIKATCDQLNTDLGIVQSTPETDRQFEQFTKSQRINSIKSNLNRWVEEYNAKSKHIDKKWWKSDALPYQLNVNEFSNYSKQ
jgi:hypothetical protein